MHGILETEKVIRGNTPLSIQFQNIPQTSRCLTHFWPVFHFYAPWKCRKTSGFLKFSGGILLKHWPKWANRNLIYLAYWLTCFSLSPCCCRLTSTLSSIKARELSSISSSRFRICCIVFSHWCRSSWRALWASRNASDILSNSS